MKELNNSSFLVENKDFNKEILGPTSKSYAARYLILASLSPKDVCLKNLPNANDTLVLINCLEKIGLDISWEGKDLWVRNSFPACENKTQENEIHLLTEDGGTTNRFLISLLSRGLKKYYLSPSGEISSRPFQDLISILKDGGVKVLNEGTWISIQGPYHIPLKIEVDCSKTTQFISAIQLALAFEESIVVPKNLKTSTGYYSMTVDVIKKFKSSLNKEFSIPLDWSSLSYPLALGALTGKIGITNFDQIDQLQGDSLFLEILKKSGAEVRENRTTLEVIKTKELKGVEVDCRDCPDLVLTLGFFCSYLSSPSLLKNIEVLKYKESNRLLELFNLFNHFNISYDYSEEYDVLKITPAKNNIEYKKLKLVEDHRVVMAAYLFLRVNSGGEISPAMAVNKSFPDFFKLMS